MRYVLEYSRYLAPSVLLSKQQILYGLQPRIHKMVPCARIAIQHGRRLDKLSAIGLASFAFECVVGVAGRVWSVLKELSQTVEGEMTLHVFSRIYHAR